MTVRSIACGRAIILLWVVVMVLPFMACQSNSPNPNTPAQPTAAPPTPEPTPTPPPVDAPGLSATCQEVPQSGGTNADCSPTGSTYGNQLNQAIDSVNSAHLDGNKIINISGYLEDVVDSLDQQGLCAVPEADILFVRNPNDDFNDYFDIITSTGGKFRQYTNTCTPAVATPSLPPAPSVRDPSCALPSSRSLICVRETPVFDNLVTAAISAVIADDMARSEPILFDFSQQLAGVENGFKVLDFTAYHEAVIEKLRDQGFCGFYDGEEIQMKNTNMFSEHWDIIKAEGFVIQLYAGVCRDAEF